MGQVLVEDRRAHEALEKGMREAGETERKKERSICESCNKATNERIG